MDKHLTKIGGVTIERISKAATPPSISSRDVPALPPGVSFQKKSDPPFQSSISSADQGKAENFVDFDGNPEEDEEYDHDDDVSYPGGVSNQFAGGSEKTPKAPAGKSYPPYEAENNDGEIRQGSKSPIFVSSEEDGAHEFEGGNESEEGNSQKIDTSDEFEEIPDDFQEASPVLPPGITFQRKNLPPQFQPKLLPSVPRPNVQLPRGITLGRRPGLDNRIKLGRGPIRNPSGGRLPFAAVPPRIPALRGVRPPLQRVARHPMDLLQRGRAPSPALVRPSAQKINQAMMNKMMMQKLQPSRSPAGPRTVRPAFRPGGQGFRKVTPGRGPIAVDAHEFLQQLIQRPLSTAPRPTRPPPTATKRPGPIKLPPGITVQPRKKVIEEVSVDEDDSDEEESPEDEVAPSPAPLPTVPPGINLERKKVDKIERVKPFMQPAEEQPEKGYIPPTIQLPPGISLEKKINSPQLSSTPEKSSPKPEVIDPTPDMTSSETDDMDEFADDGMEGDEDEEEEGEEEIAEEEEEEDLELGEEEEKELDESHEDEQVASPVVPSILPNPPLPSQEAMDCNDAPEEPFDDDAVKRPGEMDDEGEEEEEEPEEEQEQADPPQGVQPDLDCSEEFPDNADEDETPNQSVHDDSPPAPELEKAVEMDIESLISSSLIKTEKTGDSPGGSQEEPGTSKEDLDDMKNLVEMMTKGEFEGEIEDEKGDEKDEEDEEDEEKKAEKRKGSGEDDEDVVANKKKKEGEDGEDEEDVGNIDKSKVSGSHLRKNIREVMDETKLDEATLAAQRQEAERLKRLQDQQRIIREVQRQIQKTNHSQKYQNKVLSLLQGNSQTSILKTSSLIRPPTSPQPTATSSNTVSLKLANGQQTNLSDKVRELLTGPGRPAVSTQSDPKSLLDMVSSSVTIAPIKKEPLEDKRKSVVTLSSDSDDDCIVLSEDEIESEPEEDPTNSGMHTTDKYNVLDDQGRVLVNVGHPAEEPEIFLAPQIARVIKPHQIGGIRFLYDNIIESLERYNNSPGFGCILAHSMGLGKTLQIVSFADVFLNNTSGKKVLCIMPINTIQNWLAEFNMWTPKENHTEAEIKCRNFDIYIVNESLKNIHSRGRVILDWHKNGGVLLMGYELFRLLSLKKPIKSKRKRPDESEEERNRELVEDIYSALVKPGPDLVICDEGHRIKNSHATTSQALKQIRTRRRIVLTGYPLQNNLLEYWCMVDFVRPNYLGSKTEFSNMFERPIQNGQCIDSTPQDIRLMRFRAHVLHSLLEGFVQRRSHAVLQEVLPQKEEYVLLLRFTSFQRKLYDTFMNEVVRTVAVPNPLKAFAVCCKIWNHPDVLFNFLKKKGEQIDLDLEEALPPTGLLPRPPNEFGVPANMVSNYPPTLPPTLAWPKKGPGSRGGRIRTPSKKKGAGGVNHPPEKPVQPDSSLPSMSQFTVQSSSGYGSTGLPSTSNSFQQQSNYYPQQPHHPQQHQHHSNNFPYQQTNYDASGFGNNQKMFGNEQKLYGNDQKLFGSEHKLFGNDNVYGNQQKLGGSADQRSYGPDQKGFGNQLGPTEQKLFGNHDFNAGFSSGMSSNFYQHGQQSLQPSTGDNGSHFGGISGQHNQFYQHNEGSVSSGFDFGQTNANEVPTDFHMSNFRDGFDNANFPTGSSGASSGLDFPQEQQFWGNNWPSCSGGAGGGGGGGGAGTYSGGSSGDEFMSPPKFPGKEEVLEKGGLDFGNGFPGVGRSEDGVDGKKGPFSITPSHTPTHTPSLTPTKLEIDEKKDDARIETPKKEETPHEWAAELFKNYVTGLVENSSKMEVFFLILTQSTLRQDRMLVFSQSLLTLDLIEEYLQKRKVPGREEHWARNRNYFRLDGSTPALEREKLINEFNANPHVVLFLVSTRAGSLGINLVGANRVIVFDASWNPCHDTQAVCRVYRYGQQKPCYVYRLVMDCCLEKKIYDRQINKQGMADRVVDELNPDAHLSIKEVTNLCWDDQDETSVKDFSDQKSKYRDDIIQQLVVQRSSLLSKEPFQHESLLIDRKEKKLSQAEKRLAKRSYELEKQASNQPRNLYQLFPNSSGGRNLSKPIASVKPMQSERFGAMPSRSKWIPAEVWQKQGMSAQEMTLPLDVVIPTNSPDKTSIVLKAGQRVMVLKSPKGIYMQLETGKIIAIRTAFKVGQSSGKPDDKKANPIATALKNNPNVTITQKSGLALRGKAPFLKPSSLDKRAAAVNMAASKGRIAVNNKNRVIPPSRKLQVISQADKERMLAGQKVVEKPETETIATASATTVVRTVTEDVEPVKDLSDKSRFEDSGNGPKPPVDSLQVDACLGSFPEPTLADVTGSALSAVDNSLQLPQTSGVSAQVTPDPLNGATTTQTSVMSASQDTWSRVTTTEDNSNPELSSTATQQTGSVTAPTHTDDKSMMPKPVKTEPYSFGLPASGDGATEVKKEEDKGQGWPVKQGGYPVDPYGNYYPPGYYGYGPMGHVPGYEGYGYPRNYPPPVPIKTEKQEGSTPPPAAPVAASAAPPLYPPYPPNPYPYPYNYPPFPPQAQPPGPTPAPATPVPQQPKAGESSSETAAPFVPPYTPRPSYPSTHTPGFYPNYPPYRPFPDPNFPYPNYNPYMPYGYPMQGTPPAMPPHQMPPHQPGVDPNLHLHGSLPQVGTGHVPSSETKDERR